MSSEGEGRGMLGESVAGIRAEPQAATGFETAFQLYQSSLFNYALRMLGDHDSAYDATLASFEKAYRAWDRLPADADVRAWLYRITTNTCLDELRRRKVIRWQPWESFTALFHPKQVAPDNPEREAVRGERSALVRQALRQLPPKYRAALVMRECEGLSCEEIGAALGISRGAAKLVLLRARRKLKEAYLDLGGEPFDD